MDAAKRWKVDPTLIFGREGANLIGGGAAGVAGGGAGGQTDLTTSQSGQAYVSTNPPKRSKDGTKILGKIGNTVVELVPDGKGGYRIK
jgi:hypothetical protein